MADIIITAVIAALLGTAVISIRRARKKGIRCVGCPSGGCCAGCAEKRNEEKKE